MKELFKKISKYIAKYKNIILIILVTFLSIIDYWDITIVPGLGFFSKQFKPNPVELLTAIFLFYTLMETMRTRRESTRQTELTLRPYIRFSWDSTQIGGNRRGEGVSDTCIVVSNNGNGLMRSVKYNVKVDNNIVAVRNHTIIVSSSSTNMVYDDSKNKYGDMLGSRNDSSKEPNNSFIIRNSNIEISGTYRDMEGGKYIFKFEKDNSEQSWFKEKWLQKRVN